MKVEIKGKYGNHTYLLSEILKNVIIHAKIKVLRYLFSFVQHRGRIRMFPLFDFFLEENFLRKS